MQSIEEIMDSCIDDMVNFHLHSIQKENVEMQKIKVQVDKAYCELEERMDENEVLHDLFKMFQHYDDLRNSEEIINYHHIYLAGIKDCVALLIAIGVVKRREITN